MAQAGITKIVIYQSAVKRFMGTDVKDWVQDFAKDAKHLAQTDPLGPESRTGNMKARHYYRVRNRGTYITAEMGNKASYAKFVHEGTYGPIRAKGYKPARGPKGNLQRNMVFFSRGRWWKFYQVSGQDPNPWLWRATRAAAKARGI